MKKMLLSLPLLGLSLMSVAQPTIQSNQYNYTSIPGFSFKYSSGQTAVSPGPSGANVTWNFGSLPGPSTLDYTTAGCPGDNDCASFPGANQALILASPSSKTFWNKTANTLEQVGEKGNGSNAIFSDSYIALKFPITFGQAYSDSYASSMPAGTRNGTMTSTIDAYGTLTTPAGTFTNVLRQKIVENATVTTNGQTLNLEITHYYWFKANTNHYLMAIIATQPLGLPVPVPATYVTTYATSGTVDINDNEVLQNDIVIYPNPATNKFTIQTSAEIKNISLYNILGQKVMEKSFTGIQKTVTVDNLQLSKGYYLLKVNTHKGLVTKKIAIQ